MHACTHIILCTHARMYTHIMQAYGNVCKSICQTHIEYKWIEPKLCRDDLPKSTRLPGPSAAAKCPPCNPGMQLVSGSCQFCPPNKYSDGIGQCRPCPVSTAPSTELTFKWWNNLPPDANLTSHCLSTTGM